MLQSLTLQNTILGCQATFYPSMGRRIATQVGLVYGDTICVERGVLIGKNLLVVWVAFEKVLVSSHVGNLALSALSRMMTLQDKLDILTVHLGISIFTVL